MTFITTFIQNLFPPVTLVGIAGIIALAIVLVLTFVKPGKASPVHGFVKDHALMLGGTVALSATLGSLFYSEILGYTPCTLCWYQRILMYPQVLLFGVAMLSHARDVFKYTIALSLVGFSIAVYHYIVQIFNITTNCVAPGGRELIEEAGQCTTRFVFDYGFLSIPFMAAVAFALILLISLLALRKDVSRRDR